MSWFARMKKNYASIEYSEFVDYQKDQPELRFPKMIKHMENRMVLKEINKNIGNSHSRSRRVHVGVPIDVVLMVRP